MINFKRLLSIGQAAKFLGVSIDTLRNWEKQGKIIALRTEGGVRRYRLPELKKVQQQEPRLLRKTFQASENLNLDKNLASQGQALQGSQPQPISNTTSIPSFTPQLHPLWGSEELNSEELRETQNTRVSDDQNFRNSDSLTIRSSGPLRKTSTPSHSESFRKLAFLAPLTFTVLFLFISTLVLAGYSYLPSSFPSSFPIPSFLSSVILEGVEQPIGSRFYRGLQPLQNDNNNGTMKPTSRSERSKQFNNSPAVLAAETVKQILEINADTNIYGLLTSEGLTINGAGSFTSLTASSSATFSGPATFEGSLTSTGGLTASGGITTNSITLTNTSTSNSLVINDESSDTTPFVVDSSGNVGIGTTSTSSYKLNLSGTFNTSGATTLGSTLAVTGATTLSSTLTVSGASTLSSTLEVSGKLTAKDELAVTGSTTLSGSLTTSGATTLSSTLAVTGASTFSSTGTFSGKLTSLGNVGIAGNVGIGTTSPVTLLDVNNKLNVLSGGNVGIGTTSPSSFKLEVAGSIGPTLTNSYDLGSSSKQFRNLYLYGTSTIGGQSTFTSTPTGTGVGDGVIYINPSTVADNSYTLFGIAVGGTEKLRMDATGNITVQGNLLGPSGGSVGYWTRAGTTLYPYTSGDNVTTTGNVGIGTTVPTYNLEVDGSSWLRGSSSTTGLFVNSTGNVGIGTTTPSTGTRLSVMGGNVGIGTTSPGAAIDIQNTTGGGYFANTGINMKLAADRYGIVLSDADGNTKFYVHTGGSGNMFVSNDIIATKLRRNGGGAALTLSTDTNGDILLRPGSEGSGGGNVGIGTTSPGYLLDLQQADATARIESNSNTSTVLPYLRFDRSRGTAASKSIVSSGDYLGVIAARGYDGADYVGAANIEFYVDGTPGTGDMPGRIVFQTTPDGSNTIQERMRIDSGGNVGIGTTAFVNARLSIMGGNVGIGTTDPTTSGYNLAVVGTGNFTGALSANTFNKVTITSPASAATLTIADGSSLITSGAYSLTLTTTNTTNVTLPTTGTLATLAGTESFSNKTFTGDTFFPSGIWNTGGNIGIGTTTPSVGTRLAVMGGNVGIGTTGPNHLLSLGDTDLGGYANEIQFGKALSNTTLRLGQGSSNHLGVSWIYDADVPANAYASIGTYGNNNPIFIDGSRIILQSSATGNVGIGTTNPGGKLTVIGGNVGIGTTSPTAPFEVKGSGTSAVIAKFTDVTTTGCAIADGGTISCSSDINLKKNISSLDYGLSEVLKLRPVNYNWKSQDDSVTKNLGFIAQEVESIIPKLVSTDDTGLKQLNTIGMVPILTKALQELDTRIMNYELRIKNLEGKVNDQSSTNSVMINDQESTSSASSVIPEGDSIGRSPDLQNDNNLVILEGGDSQLIGSLDSLATPSASLQNDIFVVSEATISAQLTAYKATIQEVFKSLGETFLGNTTIAGSFSIDGTMSLTGNSLSTLGTLYLQNGPLAGDIDLFNGQVKIDKLGNITTQGTLAAAKIALPANSSSPTIGSGTIPSGKTSLTVKTSALTEKSKVFITLRSSASGQTPYVKDITPGIDFTLILDNPLKNDLKFDWFIMDQSD